MMMLGCLWFKYVICLCLLMPAAVACYERTTETKTKAEFDVILIFFFYVFFFFWLNFRWHLCIVRAPHSQYLRTVNIYFLLFFVSLMALIHSMKTQCMALRMKLTVQLHLILSCLRLCSCFFGPVVIISWHTMFSRSVIKYKRNCQFTNCQRWRCWLWFWLKHWKYQSQNLLHNAQSHLTILLN